MSSTRSFLVILILLAISVASIPLIEARTVPSKLTSIEWHARGVECVEWAPNGTLLVSGSSDGTVKVWDVGTMKVVKTMDGPYEIRSLAYDPNGNFIVAGGLNGDIIVWGTQSFDEFTTLYLNEYSFKDGLMNEVLSISFNPTGSMMAVGMYHGVRIYNVDTWEVKKDLDIGWVDCAVFDPDGSHLLVGAHYSERERAQNMTEISLWDTSSWTEIKNLTIPIDMTYRSALSMDWKRDGTKIALGMDNETVRIIDVGSWMIERNYSVNTESSIVGYLKDVLCVSWEPNGDRIAAGYWNSIARVWSLRSSTPMTTFSGHGAKRSDEPVNDIEWSPDGSSIATVGGDTTVKVWDPKSGDVIHDLSGNRGGATCWTFADQDHALIGDGGGQVFLWQISKRKVLWNISQVHVGYPTVARTSPNGTYLAVGYGGTTYHLSDVLIVYSRTKGSEVINIRTEDTIESLAWSPDGKSLLYGGKDMPVSVLSTSNWTKIGSIDRTDVSDIEFSPDGGIFAIAAYSINPAIYATSNLSLSYTLQGDGFVSHEGRVYEVSFSPDGSCLATGGFDSDIIIWDLTRKHWERKLTGHSDTITSIAWDPKGEYILSSSKDNTVKLWNLTTWKEAWTRDIFRGDLAEVAWDPSGRFAGYTSFNSLVILFDGTEPSNGNGDGQNDDDDLPEESDKGGTDPIIMVVVIAIGTLVLVMIVLFALIVISMRRKKEVVVFVQETRPTRLSYQLDDIIQSTEEKLVENTLPILDTTLPPPIEQPHDQVQIVPQATVETPIRSEPFPPIEERPPSPPLVDVPVQVPPPSAPASGSSPTDNGPPHPTPAKIPDKYGIDDFLNTLE